MTKVAEKKILSKLDDISSRVSRIETFILHTNDDDNDDWIYEPKVVKYIKERAKLAEKEYKEGKYYTAEEVFGKLEA